jgi:phosphopantothenoylcysteine synthetase/decarboxylase
MKSAIFAAAITIAVSSQVACAQFGSGIVFDPTQSGHAIQQITQGNQLYTTTVTTTRNVIAAYNLAQRMASLPQTLYSSYSNLGRQQWIILTRPANTYGNSLPWMNAATTGYGASAANQTSSLPHTGQISGYSSLSSEGQQAIAAQGATVDLSDAVNASNLQTVGTIRANAAQREADISLLEAATHSSDPAQHTEMATLQRINQALLIELRSQQETNQILQGQALQQIVGQKVQQDNLKALFQVGNGYQQNFNYVTPQQTTAGTQWALHY